MEFKKGDKVRSCHGNGTVWKISEIGVHVKIEDRNGNVTSFAVFHFKPYHHMQTSVDKLSLITHN